VLIYDEQQLLRHIYDTCRTEQFTAAEVGLCGAHLRRLHNEGYIVRSKQRYAYVSELSTGRRITRFAYHWNLVQRGLKYIGVEL